MEIADDVFSGLVAFLSVNKRLELMSDVRVYLCGEGLTAFEVASENALILQARRRGWAIRDVRRFQVDFTDAFIWRGSIFQIAEGGWYVGYLDIFQKVW